MGFTLTDAILMHVEARVEQALAPCARWVLQVTARVEDINAERGGIDKRCSLIVALRRHGIIAVEATHADLYLAVDDAVAKARRSALRTLRRRLPRERRSTQRPGALVGA
jgi:ribosome-associated translation inhibitor RaiA